MPRRRHFHNRHPDRFCSCCLMYWPANQPPRMVHLRSVNVQAKVVDFASEVVVSQEFENTTSSVVQGTYRFPVPPGCAVNSLTVRIGDKTIVGNVEEREAAREEFKEAVRRGDGGYLAQQSADSKDIFEVSIGNLPANTTAFIRISYVCEVQRDAKGLRFVLPAKVLPRFRDAARRRDAATDTGATLVASVTFEMPSTITGVTSPTHAIEVTDNFNGKANNAIVNFVNDKPAGLEKDLVVLVTMAQPHEPHAIVELSSEHRLVPTSDGKSGSSDGKVVAATTAGSAAVMVALYPDLSALASEDDDQACEFVFIMDRSGSMRGQRMKDAKNVLQLCLRSLPEGSTFNIVSFGNKHKSLFRTSLAYNDANLKLATAEVSSMTANMGGTKLLAPLSEVCSNQSDPSRPRQVLVFTDGAVRNTQEVVRHVAMQHAITGVRVFAFGIGNGVSRDLVDGISKSAGGEAEYIVAGERMEPKVMRVLGRAMSPMLTNVHVDWGAMAPYTMGPTAPASQLPVVDGGRVLLYAQVQPSAPPADITLNATSPSGKLSWSMRVSVDAEADGKGGNVTRTVGSVVHAAMARARIADLERIGEPAKASAVALAKEFKVACKWTSFIAVEQRSEAERSAAVQAGTHAVRHHAHGPVTTANAYVTPAHESPSRDRRSRMKKSRAAPVMRERRLERASVVSSVSSSASRRRGSRNRAGGMLAKSMESEYAAPMMAMAPAPSIPPPPPAALERQSSAERAAGAGNLFSSFSVDKISDSMPESKAEAGLSRDIALAMESLSMDGSGAPPRSLESSDDDEAETERPRRSLPVGARKNMPSGQIKRGKKGKMPTAKPKPVAPRTLADYNIQKESTLHLALRLPGSDLQGTLRKLVLAQQASGCWPLAAVSPVLTLGGGGWGALQKLVGEFGADSVATAVVLHYLATVCCDLEADWTFLAKKARKWLKKTTTAAFKGDTKAMMTLMSHMAAVTFK